MSDDTYTKFLGMPAGPRPPRSYVLLGVAKDERDPQVIEAAADRQMDVLDKYVLSGDPQTREQVQRLMNQVAKARLKMMKAAEAKAHTRQASKPSPPKPVKPTPPSSPLPQSQPPVKPPQPSPTARRKTPPQQPPRNSEPKRKTKSAAGRPFEFWLIVGSVWITSLIFTAVAAYIIASGEQASPLQAVSVPVPQIDPSTVPQPVEKEPTPPPERTAIQPEEFELKPMPPGPPPTWEEVEAIQDPAERLQAFIWLRDSLPLYSKEQIDVIEKALDLFNGIDGAKINKQINTSRQTELVLLGGRPEDQSPQPNAKITDISPFLGMRVHAFWINDLKNIQNFAVLATMRVQDLQVTGCEDFDDFSIFYRVEGLKKLAISSDSLTDLRALPLAGLNSLWLDGCTQLKSLDGLQRTSINRLVLTDCPELTDISAINQINGLSHLMVARLPITSLEPIENQPIEKLSITSCESLESLKGLENHKTLTSLWLKGKTLVLESEVDRIVAQYPYAEVINRFTYLRPDPAKPKTGPMLAWEQIKKIKDPRTRLKEFIKLRDSKERFSDEQVELINKALNAFNNIEDADLYVKKYGTDTYDIAVGVGKGLSKKQNTTLKDLSPLTGLTARKLSMFRNKGVADFSFLKTMQLYELSLGHSPGFQDLSVLGEIEGLEILYFTEISIRDFTGFNAKNLKKLNANNCYNLTSLDGLEGMDIPQLSFNRNPKLTNIDALKGIRTSYLYLRENPLLEDIEVLRTVVGVTRIELKETAIKDVSALTDLPLREINISGCKNITDLSPLKKIKTLKQLTAFELIKVRQNNIDEFRLDRPDVMVNNVRGVQ